MNSLIELADKYMTDKGHFFFGNKRQKGHLYADVYDKLFTDMRDKPIKLLELGISRGASLLMWNEYFSVGKITGVDISLRLVKKNTPKDVEGWGWKELLKHDSIKMFAFGQTDEAKLKELDHPFDIIIDDASHQYTDQLRSFQILYPMLNKGGYYVVEDISNTKNVPIDFLATPLDLKLPHLIIFHKE